MDLPEIGKKKKKVLIVALAHNKWVHNSVTFMLLNVSWDDRYEKEFMIVEQRPVDHARNYVIDRFLESDCDYLLSVDHDNACTKNPLDLIGDKDIVFCPTPLVKEQAIRMGVEVVEPGDDWVEVTRASTGCFILSRKAAEAIPKPLFLNEFDDKGALTVGEDVYFCNKARENGFTLYSHMGYPCTHYYEFNVWDVLYKYEKLSPYDTPTAKSSQKSDATDAKQTEAE